MLATRGVTVFCVTRYRNSILQLENLEPHDKAHIRTQNSFIKYAYFLQF